LGKFKEGRKCKSIE